MRRALIFSAAPLFVCVTLGVASMRAAQVGQAPLAFEAASVKPNVAGGVAKEIGPAPGGRFIVRNNTFRDLIPFAYAIPQQTASFRIIGGPKWIDEDRFDITANVMGSWTPQQMSEMLRTLLLDRFKLVARRETRELPTYALVELSQAFGPQLRRSAIDQGACDARRAAIQRREPVPPIPPGAKPVCGTGRTIPGTITATGWPMDTLASALVPFVGRLVSDRTQLSGLYDFELRWTPERVPQGPPDVPRDAPLPNVDPNGPSLFTALQEQLGLKLEPTRGQVEVVVIDHVERPPPD